MKREDEAYGDEIMSGAISGPAGNTRNRSVSGVKEEQVVTKCKEVKEKGLTGKNRMPKRKRKERRKESNFQ